MKRIFLAIASILIVLSFMGNVAAKKLDVDVPKVTDHEKIKIYLFRGENCTHCYDFLSYFNLHAKQFKKYFEIVAFETYKDADNKALKNKVNDFLGITDEKERASVPLIVIGNWHMLGFMDDGLEIINQALSMYQDPEYVDYVQKIIDDEQLANTPETLNEACEKEKIKVNNDLSNAIFLGVTFLLLAGGLTAIIISSKKK